MGRLQKARSGKIIASGPPSYGFKYNDAKDGYEIDEQTMLVVHRMFRMLGNGQSLNSVCTTFNAEGIKPPTAKYWNTVFLKNKVFDDVYKPHTRDDLELLLSADILAQIEPNAVKGIWWYNQHRSKTIKKTVTNPDGTKKQKRNHKLTPLPRSEWIAVPVPDAGIPLETVLAARENINQNVRSSYAGSRECWELSGGIVYCGDCGRPMRVQNVKKKSGIEYHYYACRYPYIVPKTCKNTKRYRAEPLEARVADLVSDILSNEDRLLSEIDSLIEKEKGRLGNVTNEASAWSERIAELTIKEDRYYDLYADGDIPKERLKTKLAEVAEQRADAEKGLADAQGRTERLAELERE